MAYDKAVDSAALDAGLTAIANAIREKSGSSDALAFPDAMAAAIAGIESGTDISPATYYYGNIITPTEDINELDVPYEATTQNDNETLMISICTLNTNGISFNNGAFIQGCYSVGGYSVRLAKVNGSTVKTNIPIVLSGKVNFSDKYLQAGITYMYCIVKMPQ